MDVSAYVATIKGQIGDVPLNTPAPSGGLSQFVPYGPSPSAPRCDASPHGGAIPYYCKTGPLHIHTLLCYLP